jgi:hypothetical protein
MRFLDRLYVRWLVWSGEVEYAKLFVKMNVGPAGYRFAASVGLPV